MQIVKTRQVKNLNLEKTFARKKMYRAVHVYDNRMKILLFIVT